ncbi:hypothetical protein [Quisquiliibacterium transsilvanicum]|jgi:hypothetical protein|uniref:Uncharacterized protein n=1 Tax=Quisquiliibacterium transsilvanicum TaxID=1549638 RepID=A0A7W8MB31_9BURK|nr:hypothetical protein [Quisquiliibacterium transsilvanicum]MBB5273734.1 hypothetical protein [Quisquiliibacterium transsilvanicum]
MTVTRRFVLAAALALAAAAPVHAADVGVSVSVGQPGFYGRIDIGNYPQPRLIYLEPRIVSPAPQAASRRPIYLHVPPGHAKDWGKHCGKYAACGQPVYFVDDRWYQEVYSPEYRKRHQSGKREAYRSDDGRRHDGRRDDDRQYDGRRDERRMDRRDDGQRYEERRREQRLDRGDQRRDERRGAQGRQDDGKGKGNGGGKGKGRDD